MIKKVTVERLKKTINEGCYYEEVFLFVGITTEFSSLFFHRQLQQYITLGVPTLKLF